MGKKFLLGTFRRIDGEDPAGRDREDRVWMTMSLLVILFTGSLPTTFLNFFLLDYNYQDFFVARNNFKQGNYRVAEIFLENFISENPNDTLVPEAVYYLLKIYDKDDKIVKFFTLASKYLEDFKYDKKRDEIFNMLIRSLVEQNSFLLAFQYIKNYDYLAIDKGLLDKIALELGTDGLFLDELLKILPENDSLKILKALSLKNPDERKKIFRSIKGIKGKLYLIKNFLLSGDTLSAYYEYQKVNPAEIPKDILYPWAIISLDMDEKGLEGIIPLLANNPELKSKAEILNILFERKIPPGLTIDSPEDIRLIQRFLNTEHLDSSLLSLPDSINLDSILSDTTPLLFNLKKLRMNFKKNYFLDSIYCDHLIRKKLYKEAYDIMKDYISFSKTKNFARIIRALNYFQNGDFRDAAKDLVLARTDDPYIKSIKAICLHKTGGNPESTYEELINTAPDSLLRHECMVNYFNYKFQKKDYSAIIKFDIEDLMNDLQLIKIYLLCLVYTGRMKLAESLYTKEMGGLDSDFYTARVGYLMEKRRWRDARFLLDSLINLTDYQNEEEFFYNWCLVPFCQGDFDTAEARFAHYIKKFRSGRYYYQGLFKMGTLKYMKMDFDSAGYYYKLASKDTLLYKESMENRLTALKKAQRWHEVIEVGRELLANVAEPAANYYFEIGYAYLRSGIINGAIENLKKALELETNVEYYYWLGEAYLGQGDFIRALYQYQKIINNFERDKMWYPTALFKSGLALEMLNENEEARRFYTQIIKEYGVGDVWGLEAQKRMELLR
ncbi:MAG: tetratricopeptide repeat protein [candidate division WOR-3 bacterium]